MVLDIIALIILNYFLNKKPRTLSCSRRIFKLTWFLPPHLPLPRFPRGLTSRVRHDSRSDTLTVYVDPFARTWLGFSTTDLENLSVLYQ